MTAVVQVCYATTDIEATARSLADIDGVGPFFLGQFPLSGLVYRGAMVDYGAIKVGFAYYGDLQYELIEAPAGVPSCYAEVLDGRREAVHHTYMSRTENYDEVVGRYAREGEPLVYNGLAGDNVRFGFIDARPRLGHFVEVLETEKIVGPGAAIYDLYAKIKETSRSWVGDRPVRDMAELA